MKFRIVKIELKDDDFVRVWMKKEVKSATVMPENILSDPMKIIELGKQVSTAYLKAMEEVMEYDAIITIDYTEYNEMDLKVGDVVEIEIKHSEKS
ncbi:hypothetical protein Asulf_02015 [Archaeoglobus sulfaticallidus PM70-1]|uniref:Uncharacterized protein n=1 Tax=Archaeoglobus sulfaticallidus PM70-1 TaxID=387631 RepID=N0BNS2_9EURY|nr:hypothetical protein [Archaeoglobus sulfaticallidus]AGK61980.1 hypothetical protein Asulf_02015 [Archaeoglobus sulfaticallidus PM70-1]